MIFKVECDTTNEITDRTEHTMIVPFIVLDIRVSAILHRCHNREPLTSTAGRGPGASTPATYTRVARSLAWVRSVARGTTDSLCNTAD